MPEYAQYKQKTFRTRQEAEGWAKEQKQMLKDGEMGVAKIDIDYDERMGGTWTAKVLLPI